MMKTDEQKRGSNAFPQLDYSSICNAKSNCRHGCRTSWREWLVFAPRFAQGRSAGSAQRSRTAKRGGYASQARANGPSPTWGAGIPLRALWRAAHVFWAVL